MPGFVKPSSPAQQRAYAKRLKLRISKLTFAEQADDLVLFSEMMLRRKIDVLDAKCLLQHWHHYGPGAVRFRLLQGERPLARKTPKQIRKAATKTAPKAKTTKKKSAPRAKAQSKTR